VHASRIRKNRGLGNETVSTVFLYPVTSHRFLEILVQRSEVPDIQTKNCISSFRLAISELNMDEL
jgi:hypothetical protein